MFCSKCGANLPEGAKFCSQCGTAVAQPASSASGPGISVDQRVQTNEGQVVGLSAGKGSLQSGLSADIKQDVGVVKDSGAVVGAVLGAEGPVHVGGQQVYGEVVHGNKSEVNTGGGAYVGGSVTAGGDFVGRDRVDRGLSGPELVALFAPILQAVQSGPPEKRDQAVQAAAQLQAEVAKGKKADDETMAGLLEGLIGLAPGAISAVATAFGSPLLAGIAGPATSYVLKKLGLKK